MDLLLVLAVFCRLTGLSESEGRRYLPLCRAAAAALTRRLAPQVDLAAEQDTLCHAAGAAAYYRYVMRTALEEGAATFAAGDVKVTDHTDRRIAAARALLEEAMRSVAHLLCEDDFAFLEVKGPC